VLGGYGCQFHSSNIYQLGVTSAIGEVRPWVI